MTDRFTVRTVVVGLTVGVLFGLASMAYLAFTNTSIPDQLDRLITFLAGALTSVLVKTSHDGPTEVQVINEGPGEAVPVEPEAGASEIVLVLVTVVACLLLAMAFGWDFSGR